MAFFILLQNMNPGKGTFAVPYDSTQRLTSKGQLIILGVILILGLYVGLKVRSALKKDKSLRKKKSKIAG